MAWLNLSLIALSSSLVLILLLSRFAAAWARVRFLTVLGFQLFGILLLSWLLVTAAHQAAAPSGELSLPPAQPAAGQILNAALPAARNSLLLMGVAIAWGTFLGLGFAFLITSLQRRRLLAIAPIITLLWVLPTFLIAIFVQEIQAYIYGVTGARVSGGYAGVNSLQVAWSALVLGIRPAVYVFRQARIHLDLEEISDHVRTARAKGVSWAQVASRHILRPAAASIVATWLSSFRLMIGSLPLVEFFFAYPGLGQRLILALGLGYGDQPGLWQPDLAIALVVAMASLLVVVEASAGVLRELLDPRLRELTVGSV